MLERATETGAYQSTRILNFEDPLPIESELYDAVTAAAMYIPAIVPPTPRYEEGESGEQVEHMWACHLLAYQRLGTSG